MIVGNIDVSSPSVPSVLDGDGVGPVVGGVVSDTVGAVVVD
jgi:hypothetical protein